MDHGCDQLGEGGDHLRDGLQLHLLDGQLVLQGVDEAAVLGAGGGVLFLHCTGHALHCPCTVLHLQCTVPALHDS
ncbi:MAG: hypothetical protein NZ779_14920 [Alteromonas macleodii]|nr:hypothetical protein [Alteromonas macleodii]